MRVLLVTAVALLLAAPGASAQLMPDPNCPPTAWCHPDGAGLGGPNGFMDGMTAAADAVGRSLRDYECKGGTDCLGLALRNLMCAIDGREIAQVACGGPAGGGSGDDSGGGDGNGSSSGGSTQSAPAGTTGLALRGYSAEGFVAQVARTRVGSQLRMDGPRGMQFTLQAKYSEAGERPSRYLAVINTVAQGLQPTQMVVLVDRGQARVFHHSVFRNVRRGG